MKTWRFDLEDMLHETRDLLIRARMEQTPLTGDKSAAMAKIIDAITYNTPKIFPKD